MRLLLAVLDLLLQAQVRAELFDWTNPVCYGDYDVALACDVLYEQFSVEPMAHIAPQLLSPKTGMLLLADPSRRTRDNRYRLTSDSAAALSIFLQTKRCISWKSSTSTVTRIWVQYSLLVIVWLCLSNPCCVFLVCMRL